MKGLRQRTVRAVSWSAVQSVASLVTSTLALVVLSRLLDPAAFGVVALAAVYIAFVQVFVEQGLTDALVQRERLDPEHLDAAFWSSLGTAALLAGGSALAAPWIARLYDLPELAPVIRWLSLGLLFPALSGVQQALLRRRLEFRALALRAGAASILGAVAAVAAAWSGLGVWALVVQTLVTGAVGTAVLWGVAEWRPSLRFSRPHFRELFGFGAGVLGTNLLTFVGRNADDLLIGTFLGPVPLGYYSVGYRLVRVASALLRNVTSSAALPAFSRLQDDRDRIRRAFYQGAHYTSVLAFPAFVGMSVLAPELVRALFGPQWAPSAPVMRVLAFVGILHTVFAFNTSVMLALGKASLRFWLTFLNAVFDVLAFAIALRWGIVAVAAAFVIRGYLFLPLPVYAVHRLIGLELRTYLDQYRAPLLATGAMAAVLLAVRPLLAGTPPGVQVGVGIVVGAVVYAGALALLRPALLREVLRLSRPAARTPSP